MFTFVVVGLVMFQQAVGVIHRISDVEYDRFPPLFKVDEYHPCMRFPGDVYCMVYAKLNGSNELFQILQEYSENNITHYDHTQIHWGICPKFTCTEHLGSSNNLTEVIEACLNSTLYKQYQLNARVTKTFCTEYKEEITLDTSDYGFVVTSCVLILLNIVGTLYHIYGPKGPKSYASRLLLSFSITKNWNQMVLNPKGGKSKTMRLKCLSGFRVFSTFLVIYGHSTLPDFFLAHNPNYLEWAYHFLPYQIAFNGTHCVQTFFIMSGLLLAFNIMSSEEKNPLAVRKLPKAILNRWLRLTPPYAFMIFFMATWARHLGSGPFWKATVDVEAEDCRRDWWYHLLYIHNYVDRSQCMVHSWYLACDMQLTVVGLLIFYLLRSNYSRKVAIAVILVVGLITPGVHVFLRNLHAVLIISPETALHYFVNDETFNNLYKRGHTNLGCYALGLAFAYIVYNLKDSDIGSKKYKKYRGLYWLLFPIETSIALIGAIFFIDGIHIPLWFRVIYSGGVKVVFGIAICLHILFTILKVDKICRSVLNWGGWWTLGKISYSTYVVHLCILRTSAGEMDTLQHLSGYRVFRNMMMMIGTSFIAGFYMYLFVEAPAGNVVKILLQDSPKKPAEKTTAFSMVADVAVNKDSVKAK